MSERPDDTIDIIRELNGRAKAARLLQRLQRSENRETELLQILKEQTPTWLRIIDTIGIYTLLILVTIAFINGAYNRTTIYINPNTPIGELDNTTKALLRSYYNITPTTTNCTNNTNKGYESSTP